MSIQDAYTLYRPLVDEGSDAFLSPPRFAARYAQVRKVWLKAKAQQPETEYIKRITAAFGAAPLIVTDNIQAGIPLAGLGDLAFIRSVTCDFASGGWTLSNKSATPLLDDGFGVSLTDPTRKPDDWFPAYKEDDERIFIYADSVPIKVTIRYLRDLPAPTLGQNQASTLTESDLAVQEILDRLAGRQDLSDENASRYGATVNREIPVNEANT